MFEAFVRGKPPTEVLSPVQYHTKSSVDSDENVKAEERGDDTGDRGSPPSFLLEGLLEAVPRRVRTPPPGDGLRPAFFMVARVVHICDNSRTFLVS